MYDYIIGNNTYKSSDTKGYFITIESCAIGYLFEVMKKDYDLLHTNDKNIKLYTVLIHKEDKMSLCGFLKREERDMFNVLTSVSGVGVKMALAILNTFNISNLYDMVLTENYKSLMTAKGIGQKLAQKIIIELKGKLSPGNVSVSESETFLPNMSNENIQDANAVLQSLGYDRSEIKTSLEKALKNLDSSASAEEILKKALQILSA